MALELKVGNSDVSRRCEDASTHLEDVLFTCSEIVDKRLEQASQLEAQDICEFRTRFLPSYLSIIQAGNESERLQKPIIDGFVQLEEGLKQRNYTKAESAAVQIRASLKAYALAISTL